MEDTTYMTNLEKSISEWSYILLLNNFGVDGKFCLISLKPNFDIFCLSHVTSKKHTHKPIDYF